MGRNGVVVRNLVPSLFCLCRLPVRWLPDCPNEDVFYFFIQLVSVFVVLDRSISRVILIYWVNVLDQSLATVLSFFTKIGMGRFCAVVRSTDLAVVLFGSERLLVSSVELFWSSSIFTKFLFSGSSDCCLCHIVFCLNS